ncbi:MAG: hypothetical protein LBD76_03590 [Prevotellaceae bacterium]|jgi:hypothetical protein|nr:hypothetical protein [Prevotellaceae bacterium]
MMGHDAELKWTIYSEPDNNILTTFSLNKLPSSGSIAWNHYGFAFTLPNGISAIRFEISNNCTSISGNDVAYDDIEVRLCAPLVNITAPTSSDVACIPYPFTFSGNYTDDGTFGKNLSYRWERSATGDVTNSAGWSVVSGTAGTSSNGVVNSTYTISSVASSHAGYYRLVVSNTANINTYNCRAGSDVIRLQVYPELVGGTIATDQTICYNTKPAAFTSTNPASGGTGTITYQWQYSTDKNIWSDITVNGISPTYTPTANLTMTTYYRRNAKNTCGTVASNTITVTVLAERRSGTISKDTTVCYNTAPNTLTGTTPTGGDGNYTYYWQYSTDNGVTWDYISNSNTPDYTPTAALTPATQYRRMVTDGCGQDFSNVVMVTVRSASLYNIPTFASAFVPMPARLSTCRSTLIRLTLRTYSGLCLSTAKVV